jgi:hypothetical protein
MPIELRETTITPCDGGQIVQLHISDAPPDDESATFVVKILAKLPSYETPLLLHVQREAISMAQDSLTPILQEMASQITNKAGKPLRPIKSR